MPLIIWSFPEQSSSHPTAVVMSLDDRRAHADCGGSSVDSRLCCRLCGHISVDLCCSWHHSPPLVLPDSRSPLKKLIPLVFSSLASLSHLAVLVFFFSVSPCWLSPLFIAFIVSSLWSLVFLDLFVIINIIGIMLFSSSSFLLHRFWFTIFFCVYFNMIFIFIIIIIISVFSVFSVYFFKCSPSSSAHHLQVLIIIKCFPPTSAPSSA